jgi:hypothetical protein
MALVLAALAPVTAMAQAVTSISPTSGSTGGGTQVIITGSAFTGVTAVNFGAAAASFTFNSDTQITATSPAGTGTVDVTVTTPGGTSPTSSADQFTYVAPPPPPPTISSVSPNTGSTAGGTPVTITGTNLTGATSVKFGGVAATFSVTDDTHIAATSPAGSGTVDVAVTSPGGSATASGAFTYVAPPPPAPTVTSVSPNSGSTAGGTPVTITGTNFLGATAVNFGGTAAASFSVTDATHIAVTSPAGSGAVHVTVTTPGGTSASSTGDQFTYAGAPTVTKIFPTGGPPTGGTPVTITGSNFTLTSTVNFGTKAGTSVSYTSSSQITATSPVGTGIVNITVTTIGGTSATSSPDLFTYATAPSAPTGVTAVAGYLSAVVSWTAAASNGSAISTYTVITSTSSPLPCVAIAPVSSTVVSTTVTGLTDGCSYTFTVTATNAFGTSPASAASNAVVPNPPTVTSLSVHTGPSAGNTTVTIFGTNLAGWTSVHFGANAAPSVAVVSTTQLSVTSPAGTGTVYVTVTIVGNATSAQTSAALFTYTTVCLSVTLSATVNSQPLNPPQIALVGSTVTFTAAPTGCPNPIFEFWLAYPNHAVALKRIWDKNPTWVWSTGGYLTGSYQIRLGANNYGDQTATFEAKLQYNFTLASGCAGATMSANPASPQQAGTTVTFTASSALCVNPPPVYRFWWQYVGTSTWHIGQDFNSSNTWTWGTSRFLPGSYKIVVWANQSGTSTTTYQTYAQMTIVLTGCYPVSLSANPSQPQHPGTAIVLTAQAAACTQPQYQFWKLAPGSSSWLLMQAYSSTITFPWSATGQVSGTYSFMVWAIDAGSGGAAGNTLGRWDSYIILKYTLSSTGCVAPVTISASPASGTAPPGTPVTITASAAGCPTSALYQFWILAPGSSTWRIVLGYSTASSYSWSTGVSVAGTYNLAVWLRDAGSAGTFSSSLGRYDALANTLYSPISCTSVGASSSPPSTATVGTSVTISAVNAVGCPSPVFEFWMLAPGASAWTLVQGYLPNANVSWATTGKAKGVYHFSIWARDASSPGLAGNSLGRWDAYNSVTYTLT